MRTPQCLPENARPKLMASRRGILGTLAVGPVVFSTWAIGQIAHQMDADEYPAELQRTLHGRQLSRARYHNAEGFFRSAYALGDRPGCDRLYSAGIVIQLGLSAHLLDVGFNDHWCARHLGLHVSRSLRFANATGLGFDPAGFELLAALLSPYGKWRNRPQRVASDFPFADEEIRSLVRLMLDHVRDVTGHPRPRGWRTQSPCRAAEESGEDVCQRESLSEQALPPA
jgi:hypothetical protein